MASVAAIKGIHIGANGVAGREALLAHLGRLQSERRKAVLVQAPSAIVNQALENLPEGGSITPCRITATFNTTQQALLRL